MQPLPASPASASGPPPAPQGDITAEHRRGAAAAVLLVGTSAAVGAILGGFNGALAGMAVAGGARNAMRAGKDWNHQDGKRKTEAARSGMMALIELGLGGYFIYRLAEKQS